MKGRWIWKGKRITNMGETLDAIRAINSKTSLSRFMKSYRGMFENPDVADENILFGLSYCGYDDDLKRLRGLGILKEVKP